jgi:hypothetical protein
VRVYVLHYHDYDDSGVWRVFATLEAAKASIPGAEWSQDTQGEWSVIHRGPPDVVGVDQCRWIIAAFDVQP